MESGNTAEARAVQPLKALEPIFVTELGSTIDVRAVQPENVLWPTSVTDDGISMFVRLLQNEYLQPIITQYFIDNKSEIWLLFLIAHSKR